MTDLLSWIGWLLVVLLLCLILLLVPYLRGVFHTRAQGRIRDIPDLADPAFLTAVSGISASLITQGRITGFWFEIDKIYSIRLAAIRQAQRFIYFETFYMTPGQRIQEFADAIVERAEAGVEIKLIVDHFGVISLKSAYWERLCKAGVQIQFFHPFSWRSPLDYNIRDHRKMLLIDGEVAFVGGTGVSDHWDGLESTGDEGPWLDLEVRCEGAIVSELEQIFWQQWLYVGGVTQLRTTRLQQVEHTKPSDRPILITTRTAPTTRSSVRALFYASLVAAKQRIWIASPYFLPDPRSRQTLIQAHLEGLDVRILTVGPHNDKQVVYHAVRERYNELLKAGIPIYEYSPSMMHGKILLIDDRWISTGSTNLDPRSFFHNDELNLSLVDPDLAQQVEDFFQWSFSRSHLVHLAKWRRRPLGGRIMGRLALCARWQL